MDEVYSTEVNKRISEQNACWSENEYDSDAEVTHKIDNDSDINEIYPDGYCITDESAWDSIWSDLHRDLEFGVPIPNLVWKVHFHSLTLHSSSSQAWKASNLPDESFSATCWRTLRASRTEAALSIRWLCVIGNRSMGSFNEVSLLPNFLLLSSRNVHIILDPEMPVFEGR